MFNVIIVDEELAIRDELKDYFKKNLEPFSICNDFDNGEDAVQFLKENHDNVDVVITDIETAVSCSQFSNAIREREYDTAIVFLSSFHDYEYVKYAIKFDVSAYIEKPIDFNDLNEVFKRIEKQLKRKRRVATDAAADKQNLLITQFMIVLYSGFFNGYEQLLVHCKRFGIGDFALKRPCSKFTVEFDNNEVEWKYGSEGKEFAIQNSFRTKGIDIYNIFSTGSSMDLLAVPSDLMHQYKDDGFSEKINQTLKTATDMLTEMGIKVKVKDFFCFKDLCSLNSAHRGIMGEIKEEKFINALSTELLSGNFNSEVKRKIEQILSDFELDNYKIDLNAFYGGSNEKNSPVSFRATNYINNNAAIKKSLEWIHSNYNWNISLTDVAQRVMLSPVYFSRLFKANVGVSFTSYLLDFRLNKARHLLKDSMLNVREIANLVGYKDVNYFIRLFKKKYGVSPNKFKKQW